MVQWLFRNSGKKSWKWPGLCISSSGSKLAIADLDQLPYWLTPEHCAFLLRHNGGIPEKQYFCYTDENGCENLECIDFFYGLAKTKSKTPPEDLSDAILQHHDDLPRWAQPIGCGDDFFILTFWNGPREGSVWYFILLHDCPTDDDDPNDSDGQYLLADSISNFLGTLRDIHEFWAVESFVIDETVLKPRELQTKLKRLGCHACGSEQSYQWWDWGQFDDRTTIETELFVVPNGLVAEVPVAELILPKLSDCEEGKTVLHVKVSRTCREDCIALLKKGLGRGAVHARKSEGPRQTKRRTRSRR